mgnify:CR=1 FL=1
MKVSLRTIGLRKLLFLSMLLLWFCRLALEAQDYSFSHYTINDGLPTQRIKGLQEFGVMDITCIISIVSMMMYS